MIISRFETGSSFFSSERLQVRNTSIQLEIMMAFPLLLLYSPAGWVKSLASNNSLGLELLEVFFRKPQEFAQNRLIMLAQLGRGRAERAGGGGEADGNAGRGHRGWPSESGTKAMMPRAFEVGVLVSSSQERTTPQGILFLSRSCSISRTLLVFIQSASTFAHRLPVFDPGHKIGKAGIVLELGLADQSAMVFHCLSVRNTTAM